MVIYCFVPLCTTTGTSGLHRYPVDPERRKEWMEKTKTCHLLPDEKNAKVCRKHFEETDLITDMDGKKRLVPHAVPSLFLPGPLTLSWEHNYATVCKTLYAMNMYKLNQFYSLKIIQRSIRSNV